MKTTNLFLASAAALAAVCLSGCSTVDSRIQSHPEVFAQLTPQQQALVRAGQVGLGFNMDTVKVALGDPDRVTLRTDTNGESQVWHYIGYAYYNGAYLWAGPAFPSRHRGWGWHSAWYPDPGPFWDTPVAAFDRFRVEFQNGKVTSIQQDVGGGY